MLAFQRMSACTHSQSLLVPQPWLSYSANWLNLSKGLWGSSWPPNFFLPSLPSLKYIHMHTPNNLIHTTELLDPRKVWREIHIKNKTQENWQEYGKSMKHWDKMTWRKILLPHHWLSDVSASPCSQVNLITYPQHSDTEAQCQRLDFLKDKFWVEFWVLNWHQTWLLFPRAPLQLWG